MKPEAPIAGKAQSVVYGTTDTGIGLRWTAYQPRVRYAPAVLVLHPGGFKTGTAGPPNVCSDLAAAGFLALATEYRLAPPHTEMNAPPHPLPGQNTQGDEGHYPAGVTDVQAAIRAARAHPRGDGRVFCVGGSAGASNALYWAAKGTFGDDKPDRVVLCSGVYDFANTDHLAIDYPPGETNFHEAITNYLGIDDPFPGGPWDTDVLAAAAPLAFCATGNLPPIFAMISSDDAGGVDDFDYPSLISTLVACNMLEEPGPYAVANCFKLATVPVTTQMHAFKYWGLPISADSSTTVRDAVITWLKTP